MSHPIAIVGMGARFAGAPDLQAYWEQALAGKDAFGPVPADRWDQALFTSENLREADKSYAPAGAFIQDIKTFPALAFKIPPRRVEVMDPQQRFALEVTLQAFEDCGPSMAKYTERCGVFMGVTATEYRTLLSARATARMMAAGQLGEAPSDPSQIARAIENIVPPRPLSAPGMLGNMVAATIAQELNLKGPAFTTDAACASALIAVTDAVTYLRAGTIDAAVAGGVYLQITPDHFIVFSRIGAMSRQGLCLPFDARADGFVQGDGAGAVVLKRLEDAERDGDRIYAVIHGVAMNNDGKGEGPMAPVEAGQAAAIEQAWRDAGDLDPQHLGYVECHGTGTSVGDPVEFAALNRTLGQRATNVAIGSSKANIGHTMSAAGIAGLIRAALAVHHRKVPPLANFESLREDCPIEDSIFHIPTEPEAWEEERRLAAISSFGFGGTNVHAVIGNVEEEHGLIVSQQELLLMSAPDEATLRDLSRRTASAIEADPRASVAGVVRAWASRPKQRTRVGIVARSLAELVERLRGFGDGEMPDSVRFGVAPKEAPKLAFLYPGQGAQRTGMIAGIRDRFEVVDQTLCALEADLDDDLDVPLTHLLYPKRRRVKVSEEEADRQLTATQNCQPVLLAVGAALTRLLEKLGITPTVVTGHSLGEFTAASVAGVLSVRDAAKFVARRGQAMAALEGDHGAMGALMTDADAASKLLVDGAVIANYNHPKQVVVSGTRAAVEKVLARAEAAKVKAVRLEVSHAFHSPVLKGLDVTALVDEMEVAAPTLTMASGIAHRPYESVADARAVFLRHAVSPVNFTRALQQCADAGADLYLQVGAGGPLAAFARGGAPRPNRGVVSLAGTNDQDGGKSLLESLALLWTLGVDLDVAAVTAEAPLASVPPTIFPREFYWGVKDTPQMALDMGESRPGPRAVDSAAGAAVGPVAEAVPDDRDPIEAAVVGAVAAASAYPEASVRLEMALTDDLGFDSLMVADLVDDLVARVDGLAGIEQELFINKPTVQQIIDYVRDNLGAGGGGALDFDDDAPLDWYAPAWVPAPLPDFAAESPAGAKIMLTGSDRALCEALGRHLDEMHREAWVKSVDEAVTNGAVDLIVFCASAADSPEQAEQAVQDLVRVLDAQVGQGATPDLLLARPLEGLAADGLSGAVRAVAREWDRAVVKSIALEGDDDSRAGRILGEWSSSDRTVDVRWTGDDRFVRAMQPHREIPAAFEVQDDEVALVTGGTRGLGTRIAQRLVDQGAQVLLVGRGDPSEEAAALIETGMARHVRADVTDAGALQAAVDDALRSFEAQGVTSVVHCAGVLADGPLGSVDARAGARARAVKLQGWDNAIAAAGPTLRVALGLGSWAGRFGSRHQTHYASANALLASAASQASGQDYRAVVCEFGPWTDSDMVRTIPMAVRSAMRAEGVSFVGSQAGLDVVFAALGGGEGAVVLGRALPETTRIFQRTETLSVATHPYLNDHAIEGVPVLPLAAAADLLARDAEAPFELSDLRLYQGVAVREPVSITTRVRGPKAELWLGETLAYQARVRPFEGSIADPGPTGPGEAPPLSLREFYDEVTFHGPLLQGIERIEAVGKDFVRGVVRTGTPKRWIPDTDRARWSIDPLVLDSAMQLSGYVAWTRFQRAGTPVSIGRYVQLQPFPEGELTAEVRFGDAEGDRFSGDIYLRDPSGTLLAYAENVVAELRRDDDGLGFEPKPEWTDPSLWPEVKELQARLDMAEAAGFDNPYFAVHEGTARDTSTVAGRELVNYSSYNYLGLSGDARILDEVDAAVRKYGTSVSASRVASGERPYHAQLEGGLAQAQGAEDAIVFTAGHATNVTTIGHLFGSDDLILHDELIHDSILQGIKLSGAARRGFKHDDPADLEHQLRELRGHYEKCLVVVEGVYSMDGDICDLPAYVRLKKKYACLLMVDEAHSFGIIGKTGRGVGEHHGVAGTDVDLWMGTLSKSLASCGGWIAASKTVVQYLRYTAPGFVYSAGLTPANGQAALSALRLMGEETWRVEKLQKNSARFRAALVERGVDTGPARGESAVVPVVTGNSMHALLLSQRLLDQGINVQPIMYPAVADDAARLRFFISSDHSEEQLDDTARRVSETLEQIRIDMPV